MRREVHDVTHQDPEVGCLHGIIGRCDECGKIAVRMGAPGFRLTAKAADRLSGVRDGWVVRVRPCWYRGGDGEAVRGRENAKIFAAKNAAISAIRPGDSVLSIKVGPGHPSYDELGDL